MRSRGGQGYERRLILERQSLAKEKTFAGPTDQLWGAFGSGDKRCDACDYSKCYSNLAPRRQSPDEMAYLAVSFATRSLLNGVDVPMRRNSDRKPLPWVS